VKTAAASLRALADREEVGPKRFARQAGGGSHFAHALRRDAVLSPPQNGGMRDTQALPESNRRHAFLRKVIGKGHAANVRSTHIYVNQECALTAQRSQAGMCKAARMPKQHPIRPHLLAWRHTVGVTQEWLAEQVGRAHSAVQRWEAGRTGVDDTTFREIARIYGITDAELSAPPAEAEKAREMDRLLKRVQELDAASVRTLADLSEKLAPAPPRQVGEESAIVRGSHISD